MVSFCATSFLILEAIARIVAFAAVDTSFLTLELVLGEGFNFAWRSHLFATIGLMCLFAAVILHQMLELFRLVHRWCRSCHRGCRCCNKQYHVVPTGKLLVVGLTSTCIVCDSFRAWRLLISPFSWIFCEVSYWTVFFFFMHSIVSIVVSLVQYRPESAQHDALSIDERVFFSSSCSAEGSGGGFKCHALSMICLAFMRLGHKKFLCFFV